MTATKTHKMSLGLKIYRYPHDRGEKNSDSRIVASVREYLFDSDADISVIRDEYGKPHIEGACGIFVSVAHSDGLCLVAVAKGEIGIDLERADRRVKNPEALARRYFCEDEIAFLGENPTQASFTDIWVSKEALSKLIGRGIPCMRDRSIFSNGIEIIKYDDYDGYIVKIAIYTE